MCLWSLTPLQYRAQEQYTIYEFWKIRTDILLCCIWLQSETHFRVPKKPLWDSTLRQDISACTFNVSRMRLRRTCSYIGLLLFICISSSFTYKETSMSINNCLDLSHLDSNGRQSSVVQITYFYFKKCVCIHCIKIISVFFYFVVLNFFLMNAWTKFITLNSQFIIP